MVEGNWRVRRNRERERCGQRKGEAERSGLGGAQPMAWAGHSPLPGPGSGPCVIVLRGPEHSLLPVYPSAK